MTNYQEFLSHKDIVDQQNIDPTWKQSKGRCLVSDTILGQQSCVNYAARHTPEHPEVCVWLCSMGVTCLRVE